MKKQSKMIIFKLHGSIAVSGGGKEAAKSGKRLNARAKIPINIVGAWSWGSGKWNIFICWIENERSLHSSPSSTASKEQYVCSPSQTIRTKGCEGGEEPARESNFICFAGGKVSLMSSDSNRGGLASRITQGDSQFPLEKVERQTSFEWPDK
jgi:hypothetical protein